jgi:hypothetical protein
LKFLRTQKQKMTFQLFLGEQFGNRTQARATVWAIIYGLKPKLKMSKCKARMDPVDFGWTPGDPDVKTCLKVSLLSLAFWFLPVRSKASHFNRYVRNKYAIFVKQYAKKESS